MTQSRTADLDTHYEYLRRHLNRLANWEPEATMPAHFYAQKINHDFLGAYCFEALVQLDRTRAVYKAQAALLDEMADLRDGIAWAASDAGAQNDRKRAEILRGVRDDMDVVLAKYKQGRE